MKTLTLLTLSAALPMLALAATDQNGDNHADLLWHDPSTNDYHYMLMHGDTQQTVPFKSIPEKWHAYRGDFNGDGIADLWWRNRSNGTNWAYLMDGLNISESRKINQISDTQWQIATIGDFNGDNRDDVVWRHNTTGLIWWYGMNGHQIAHSNAVATVASTDWQLIGSGDMNGDGTDDLVWRNVTTGENYFYLMEQGKVQNGQPFNRVPLNWRIAAIADMNGDGSDDLLWRSDSGVNWIYLINDGAISDSYQLNTVGDNQWHILGADDFDGNGSADVLWRHQQDGRLATYLVADGAISRIALLNNPPSLDWQVVSHQPNNPVSQPPAHTPVNIPGLLQAEDYHYFTDTTPGNIGGAYRNDDVDIEPTSDANGGFNVGWVDNGEQLGFEISVDEAGSFDITARVATIMSQRQFHLQLNGQSIGQPFVFSDTGGWQQWVDITQTIDLPAGRHRLDIVFDSIELNLNYLNIEPHQPTTNDWTLVWQDEFNGSTIDSSQWSFEVNGQGGGNNELQYYTDRPDNAFIEDGKLVIQALEESYTGPDGTRQYTSARLRTLNKGDWKYGRFEVRARMPEGQGLWPAIWMLPTDWVYGGWAASGEIDIFEGVNLNASGGNTVHGTLHYGGSWPNNTHSGQAFTPSSSVVDTFHTYAIEWEEGEIRWYVDGIHYQTQTDWFSEAAPYPAPFNQQFHMILNVAVGGNWPGSPDANTTFPQRMEVDYVRVYQKSGSEPEPPPVTLEGACQTSVLYPQQNTDFGQIRSSSDGHITQQANGDLVVEQRIQQPTHQSTVYIKTNGVLSQHLATVSANNDGSYTHRYVRPAKHFKHGDHIEVRFVALGAESVFTPPLPPKQEGVPFIVPWTAPLTYEGPANNQDYASYVDNSFVSQLPNGDIAFCHQTDIQSDVSQIFFRINGQQFSGEPQVYANADGSFTHVYIHSGHAFNDGDQIDSRFYIVDNGAGVFIPGPLHEGWSNPLTYRSGFSEAIVDGNAAPSSDLPPLEHPQDNAPIMPLYDMHTPKEPVTVFDRGDAIVTRFADRARDRHAREDNFQAYDHYLTHYWEHRTARYEFVDYVAKGGSTIDIKYVTEWTLSATEFRAFYSGEGGTNSYHNNAGPGVVMGPKGRYDDDFNYIDEHGDQRLYSLTIDRYYPLRRDSDIPRPEDMPLEIGQFMEFESSLFLDQAPIGRDNYYATTFLYAIGQGGLVPWYAKDFGLFDFETPYEFKPDDPDGERENSHPIDPKGWLGGRTTLPYMHSGEPDNHFMQMATNLSSLNGQPFVLGRRIHHTAFDSGQHDESPDNGVFEELAGKLGTHYVNKSCSSCHERNGKALVAPDGEALTRWVFKVAAEDGSPDPLIGSVLQPNNTGIDPKGGEGRVAIDHWETNSDGLRSPIYRFEKTPPARFSARIAPHLVGLGLLEAINEADILALEDVNDANQDGISGKAQRINDPISGETRLGRFGWKAATTSLEHQIAGALNTDMGVMTSILPLPDCGSLQTNCGNNSGAELNDQHLEHLVKYIALLGVRARRDLNDPTALEGEQLFTDIGCAQCHQPTFVTSAHHPLAELRSQTIHPYTDMLVHDMGPGLADNLGEGDATGAEWRTTPLWGLGLTKSVSEGTGNEAKTGFGYLHDGRARTIDEAIRWHGGEALASKTRYDQLTQVQRDALIRFLESL